MKRKHLVVAICAAVVVAAFALSRWLPAPKAALPNQPAPPQRASAPDAVVYSALFHHVVAVKDQADEAERQGKDARGLRSLFREKADLSEAQARILDSVAADCVREVDAQDARAQVIINAFKARFPPGKLPAGVKLPPPPPELAQMQQERDAMILRARDRLRQAFGDTEFQRFDEFVTRRVASAIQPIALSPRASQRGAIGQLNRTELFTVEGGRGK